MRKYIGYAFYKADCLYSFRFFSREIFCKKEDENYKEKLKSLNLSEEKYKNIIIEKLGNNDNGFSEKFIVTYKKQQRSDIDKSRLKKEQPNIYKEYQKTTSLRIMRVKEANWYERNY